MNEDKLVNDLVAAAKEELKKGNRSISDRAYNTPGALTALERLYLSIAGGRDSEQDEQNILFYGVMCFRLGAYVASSIIEKEQHGVE